MEGQHIIYNQIIVVMNTWTILLILTGLWVVVHDVGILVRYDVVEIIYLLREAWYITLLQLQLLSYESRVLLNSIQTLLLQNTQEVDHILLSDGGLL